jgi:hypothetical protein
VIRNFWRLSEATEDNLGLACTDDGLVLGRTALIERHGERLLSAIEARSNGSSAAPTD